MLKLSELIKELQNIEGNYGGDLEVFVTDRNKKDAFYLENATSVCTTSMVNNDGEEEAVDGIIIF